MYNQFLKDSEEVILNGKCYAKISQQIYIFIFCKSCYIF